MDYRARIAILIHHEDPRQSYAKGGLVVKAKAVRGAGRYGDTELIHVNRDELDELRRMWGEPTINPETGMPEFFLGKFGKILGKVAKIAAPIAVSFIPGIGPIAAAGLGAAVGAGTGALGGGGWKGALMGGLTGAAGAGLGNLAGAGKVFAGGAKALAPAATSIAPAATSALPSSALSLSPALTTPITAATTALPTAASAAPALASAAPTATSTAANVAGTVAKPNFWNQNFLGLPIKNKFAIPLGVGALTAAGALTKPKDDMGPTADQFFSPALGGHGTGPAGATLSSGNSYGPRTVNPRPLDQYSQAGYMPEYNYFSAEGGPVDPGVASRWHPTTRVNASDRRGVDYGVDLPIGRGNLSLDASGYRGLTPQHLALALSQPLGRGTLGLSAQPSRYARGLMPDQVNASYTLPFDQGGGVDGEGNGRDDKIPARLSDGEYVMDAETVAMLGDGSTKAGAKALDDFRVNLRKQKGAKLAKGAISAKAKAPSSYLTGARV